MAQLLVIIQVSEELKEALGAMKLVPGERYEDVIWGLLEDTMGLSEQTKRNIAESLEDIKAGRTVSLEDFD
jgi:hypothetical protein